MARASALLCFCLLVIYLSEVLSQNSPSYRCSFEKEGLPMDGPCGEQCICLEGRLDSCCRKRKNFVSMTRTERLRYVNAVIKVSTQGKYQRKYNRLISIHSTLFSKGIHDKDQFLPWHRWYLLKFENLLREVDCKVTLPYWDWSFFPGAAWDVGEDQIWSAKDWGLGGNGRGVGRCVTKGRFSGKWRLTPSARRVCLRRAFDAKPPDIIAVYLTKAYSARQFSTFELELRANLHDTVHCRVGGTMCNQYSANAPEFFLHHAFIDKIWSDWQEKSTANLDAYFTNIDPGVRLRQARYLPMEYRDTLYLPHPDINRRNAERICVIYKDPEHPLYDEIMSRLGSLTTREIRRIPRRAFRPATLRQLKRLGVHKKERRKSRKLLKKIEPRKRKRIRTKDLQSILDKMLGFDLANVPFKVSSAKASPRRSADLSQSRWFAKALNSTRNPTADFASSRFANVSRSSV